ncbi:hypothetical protein [Candidatus Cetobacterium colombiensis]|uniref:Helix-turn-helix domain-containing protein n=1 Tax=Candidatus Cetobacterium colombiensis TaxID=3073100 RepID=A0ABU4WAM4_9FUSO|nr:hypothetical protein [Candidatus Cetobacterium colombiensis]MDX8336587.1 hypothetical protein [Candidatus Cetobacterium colombiensis]
MSLFEKLHLLNNVNSTLEVAKFFNRSTRTIRRYKASGLLSSDGTSNKLLFSKEAITDFIISRGL